MLDRGCRKCLASNQIIGSAFIHEPEMQFSFTPIPSLRDPLHQTFEK